MAASVTVRWLVDSAMQQAGIDRLTDALSSGSCVWIDVLSPDRETLDRLAEPLHLHPLAIEDCLHDDQRPKMEAYPDNLFLVWRMPSQTRGEHVSAAELDVFLGHGWLLTSHVARIKAVDEVVEDGACTLERGPEWLLHEILDHGVDEAFPVLDAVGDDLDEIGDVLLDRVDRSALPRLHQLKRRLLQAHKVLAPERDALRELAREQAYVSEEAYRYFQDVSDHLARLEDRVDTYRDVASSVMDIYMSAVNNQLNVVMKRLTVVATVFMPGTFIAGIYGMNLRLWPRPAQTHGFAFVLALIVIVTGSMLIWFKRSDWW